MGQAHGTSELQVKSLVKYPGSSTSFEVAGVAYITPVTDDTVQLTWKLTGADDACPTGSGNVCGIHIHSGTTCDDAALVGGHLFKNGSVDPWTAVRYSSSAGISQDGTGFQVTTGLPIGDLLGRALVVHNAVGAGERIACGITEAIVALPLVVKTWVSYPGSTWPQAVTGSIAVTEKPAVIDSVTLTWDLQGTDDACPTGSGNVCGIHIHSGTTCDDAALVGGHFWNADEMSEDPWTAVRYASASESSAGSAVVALGENRSSIIGRAMVVHNSVGNGERIACGIIEEVESCQEIFGQCGGNAWEGPTCCVGGTTCTKKNDWYSQCLPLPVDNCVAYYGKCGGKDFPGPTTCCIASQECVSMSEYYSGCRDVGSSRRLAANGADIHI